MKPVKTMNIVRPPRYTVLEIVSLTRNWILCKRRTNLSGLSNFSTTIQKK